VTEPVEPHASRPSSLRRRGRNVGRGALHFLAAVLVAVLVARFVELLLPTSGVGDLVEIQERAHAAVVSFQPWELGRLYVEQLERMQGFDPSAADERDSPAFKECMATPVNEIKHREFHYCLNHQSGAEPDRLCKAEVCRATIRAHIKNESGGAAPSLMIPFAALFYLLGNLFFEKDWTWGLVILAQLFSGAAIVVAAIRWYGTRKKVMPQLVIFVAPIGVIVMGSAAAIPVQWAAELGVEVFRWIIHSGGLVTQACCSIYLPMIFVQKSVELPLHRLGEKGLAALFHRRLK